MLNVQWINLTEARIGILRCRSLPPPVPVISQASLTVVPSGSVLTQADTAAVRVIRVFGNTNIGVAVTLASSSDLHVSDAVVIRLQHLRIHEHFVSERVQTNENNSEILEQSELCCRCTISPDICG